MGETLIYLYFQKNVDTSGTVRAPVKNARPGEEGVVDAGLADGDEEPNSLIGSSRNLAGSVVQEIQQGGVRVLNAGARIARKSGQMARTVSQSVRRNASKMADEGMLTLIGFLNALGDLGSGAMKNVRKIGGAKMNLIRQTSGNMTDLGVSSTKLAGQAMNTPVKMLGDSADVASVGLSIPANASGFMKRKSIDVMKAVGATGDGEESDSEETEEPKKPVSPKRTTTQKPT